MKAEKNIGFSFISGSDYLTKNELNADYDLFHRLFRSSLASDGVRNRSYLKLKWQRVNDKVVIAENQNYFQSADSNVDDGGKVRSFASINSDILNSPIMKSILRKNISVIKQTDMLSKYSELTFGIHFIQYLVTEGGASYSSPVGLHVDDEPLVFVHMVSLSDNAIGGNNLIAQLEDKEITNVIRLDKRLDTICLTQEVYHAVTPLGATKDEAHRDVILFTVEPDSTQK